MPAILIEIAKRRQRPGGGSRQERPRKRSLGMNFKDLISVPFAIVGGQATKMYMPERSTLDWDLLVHADDVETVRADLEQAGAFGFTPLAIPGFACRLADGTALDIIGSDEPWTSTALADSAPDLDGQPVIRLPWLILMKLKSGRVQDLADVSRMLAWTEPSLFDEVRSVIEAQLPDAREDLQSLLDLGRLERGDAT